MIWPCRKSLWARASVGSEGGVARARMVRYSWKAKVYERESCAKWVKEAPAS